MNVWLFFLQRGTAFLLLPMVVAHLLLIVIAVQGGLTAEEILSRTRGSAWWAGFYCLFVAAAAVHAAIGVKTLLAEWLAFGPRAQNAGAFCYSAVLLVTGFRAVYAVVAG